MTRQNRAGASSRPNGAGKTREDARSQQATAAQASLERERIAAEVAARFSCYGEGTQATGSNPIARTLAEQPAQFAFGVPVRAVVDAVLDLAGALPIVPGGDA